MNTFSRNERRLLIISLLVSAILWLLLLLLTLGTVLIYAALVFGLYVLVRSAAVANIKGNGIKVGAEQYPDLHQALVKAQAKLNLATLPAVYLVKHSRYAQTTRFMRRHLVLLNRDIVTALIDKPQALNFYVGHELAAVTRKHMSWRWLLLPASVLPILGAALRRARIYSADQCGFVCCNKAEDACAALIAMELRAKRALNLESEEYRQQLSACADFGLSLHELHSDKPWLIKRLARASEYFNEATKPVPHHHRMAVFFALFIPRLNRRSALIIAVAIVLFAVLGQRLVYQYNQYQMARDIGYNHVYQATLPYTQEVNDYVKEYGQWPVSMIDLGYDDILLESESPSYLVHLYPQEGGSIEVAVQIGSDLNGEPLYLIYVPSKTEQGIVWQCKHINIGLISLLPQACKTPY